MAQGGFVMSGPLLGLQGVLAPIEAVIAARFSFGRVIHDLARKRRLTLSTSARPMAIPAPAAASSHHRRAPQAKAIADAARQGADVENERAALSALSTAEQNLLNTLLARWRHRT
jgi:alpha/beta superfamily hydrolase